MLTSFYRVDTAQPQEILIDQRHHRAEPQHFRRKILKNNFCIMTQPQMSIQGFILLR